MGKMKELHMQQNENDPNAEEKRFLDEEYEMYFTAHCEITQVEFNTNVSSTLPLLKADYDKIQY